MPNSNALPEAIQALRDEVAHDKDVTTSAILLINGFATRFEAAKGDADAIQALVNEMRGSNAELAQAVIANTPADVTVEPPA